MPRIQMPSQAAAPLPPPPRAPRSVQILIRVLVTLTMTSTEICSAATLTPAPTISPTMLTVMVSHIAPSFLSHVVTVLNDLPNLLYAHQEFAPKWTLAPITPTIPTWTVTVPRSSSLISSPTRTRNHHPSRQINCLAFTISS